MALGRREFTRITAAAAISGIGAASPFRPAAPRAARIRISVQVGGNPSDEDLQFVKQLGVEYVNLNTGGERRHTREFQPAQAEGRSGGAEGLEHRQQQRPQHGRGHAEPAGARPQDRRSTSSICGTWPKRGSATRPTRTWATASGAPSRETTRGGASRGRSTWRQADEGNWAGKVFTGPLTHGRSYCEKEIWDNYTYFIRQVVPVAESLGICIGIHPDDPPVPELGGVPRCIFSSFEGYRRALEIADSPNVGMCLCVGCWLEGGKAMGKDVVETIRYFGRKGKIFKVHFRNVNAPLPHFVETFMDDGYTNMYPVMRALREVNFDGAVIADHLPALLGGPRAGTAYSVAYMRALIERADDEFGRG